MVGQKTWYSIPNNGNFNEENYDKPGGGTMINNVFRELDILIFKQI